MTERILRKRLPGAAALALAGALAACGTPAEQTSVTETGGQVATEVGGAGDTVGTEVVGLGTAAVGVGTAAVGVETEVATPVVVGGTATVGVGIPTVGTDTTDTGTATVAP